MVEPFTFFLATFLSSVVAATEVLFAVEAAAASLCTHLESLYFFLQWKNVTRGFIVPFFYVFSQVSVESAVDRECCFA